MRGARAGTTSRWAAIAACVSLLACGARSELADLSVDASTDASVSRDAGGPTARDAGRRGRDAGGRDAGSASSVPPELLDVWWFGLTSGAIRYYAVAVCDDGRARLRTSFQGNGAPDPGDPHEGRAFGSGPLRAVLEMDVPAEIAGFERMNVRYEPTTDTLVWEEEDAVFPGWASGGGVRDSPFPPADFLTCD